MHLPSGTNLQGGRYRIIRFIASGGFGCTYEAFHPMLKKKVAIKEFFPKSMCNRDSVTSHVTVGTQSQKKLVEKLKNKFVNEAQSIAQLSHPGIVKVSDVFEENGTAYYVMDYIEGKSLGKIIDERGPLSEKEALDYMRQVCDALDYVHKQNRLHLDIKPGNIMIDNKGRAILIDFGASKQYDEENGENTSTLLGWTAGYAPLEQLGKDVGHFRPATDIYALGGTLYKCLTGKVPLEANLLAQGEELDPMPSNISESTRKAIDAALEVSPKKRPQTVEDFESILFPNNETDNHKGKDSIDVSQGKKEEIKKEVEIKKDGYTKYEGPEKEINSEKESETEDFWEDEPKKSSMPKIILGVATTVIIALICWMAFGGNNSSSTYDEYPEESITATYDEYPDESITATTGVINGHEWVDLGLPSGLKWATCNVGASAPEECGDYFAWGEIDTKSKFSEGSNLPYKKGNKWLLKNGYLDGNENLTLSYDAANQNWGETWRLPTKNEIEELVNFTTSEWATINDMKGRLIKSKKNGNTIFLPASGFYWENEVNYYGESAGYWGSTPFEVDYELSYGIYLDSDKILPSEHFRYYGIQVRPVSD